jgi:hypothetical protein
MVQLHWSIRGNCDRVYYSPNDLVYFNLVIDNYSNSYIKIPRIQVIFDFENYNLSVYDIIIPPCKQIIENYTFNIPSSEYGRKTFTIVYDINYYNGKGWAFYGTFRTDKNKYFINILPRRELNTSKYIVFLSRGIRGEDRSIGDFIAQRIRQWNFETRTVGIEINVPNEETSQYVRNKIKNADALIAIATPRSYDQVSNTWRTLEWLQSELGIAYGINKPLLILQENTVKLESLPSYLTSFEDIPLIIFDRYNLYEIINNIDYYIPYFREAIKKDRVDNFFSSLIQAGILTLAGIKGIELIKNAFDGFISESKE